jgi:uncharacterized surface protein with fasciclin (FAS1) repeats
MRSRFLGVSAAVIGLGLIVTACSSSGNSAAIKAPSHKSPSHKPMASTTPASDHSQMAASASPATATKTIGDACSKLPTTGMGSVSGMASEPVGTAISHNPELTQLAHAIDKAGLTATLNSATAVTVFAPNDSAFHALGSGNLKTLLASKTDLTKLLEYHLVKGKLTPADLAAGKPLTTEVGLPVHPAKSGSDYTVNGARVTCGDIQTANGTIYILDKVLIPTT